MLWFTPGIGRWARSLAVLFSFVTLLVHVSHPALHPLEIINPAADGHYACPLSHTAAALLIAFLLLGAELWRGRIREPLPWLAHSPFMHRLAARPPPA